MARNNLPIPYMFLASSFLMTAILIPMTYLINESRVKDIIIIDGWIQGIKSIFYSSEKIRQLELEKHTSNLAVANQLDRQNDTKPQKPRPPLRNSQNERNEENISVAEPENNGKLEEERDL